MAVFDLDNLPDLPPSTPEPTITLDEFVHACLVRAQKMRAYWETQRAANPSEAECWPLEASLEEWDHQFAAWMEMGEPEE